MVEVPRPDIARLHLSLSDKPYQANGLLALLSNFLTGANDTATARTAPIPVARAVPLTAGTRPPWRGAFRRRGRTEYFSVRDRRDPIARPYQRAAVRDSHPAMAARRVRAFAVAPSRQQDRAKSHLSQCPRYQVLAELPRIEGNPFVVCGKLAGARLINLQKPWRRIRKAASLDDVRIHDLRHSFASVAAASGQSLPVIGALPGHTQPQTTARYAHLSADPLRTASDAIGERLANSLGFRSLKQWKKTLKARTRDRSCSGSCDRDPPRNILVPSHRHQFLNRGFASCRHEASSCQWNLLAR